MLVDVRFTAIPTQFYISYHTTHSCKKIPKVSLSEGSPVYNSTQHIAHLTLSPWKSTIKINGNVFLNHIKELGFLFFLLQANKFRLFRRTDFSMRLSSSLCHHARDLSVLYFVRPFFPVSGILRGKIPNYCNRPAPQHHHTTLPQTISLLTSTFCPILYSNEFRSAE